MRVGLAFGGRSREHEVSIVSARTVAQALQDAGHEVLPLAVAKDGLWADRATSARVLAESGDRTELVLGFGGSLPLAPELLDGSVEVLFPILHGPYGEDGTIQGLAEVLDLPYVGCDVTASSVCMHKALTKRLLRDAGLRTPQWIEVSAERWAADADGVSSACAELGSSLFVKPARLGSSVGITKVRRAEELADAIHCAREHDDLVIVERAVHGREIEVPVIGNRRPRAAVPGEVVPGHEFYDYSDKYVDDACRLLAPAPLDPPFAEEARRIAEMTYAVLGCEGMARVDLFLERGTSLFWVNEVNTIPGFTAISMFPKLWRVSGMSYSEQVDELVRLALERHGRRLG